MGAGKVGSTTAQLLSYMDICDVVLWNRTADYAKGVALDIKESSPIQGFDSGISGTGSFSDIKGSDVVVLTAGAPRKEGMSREDLLNVNAEVVKSICTQIKKYAPDSKLIVLTNPLDSMVYLAKRITGFPKERIVGMAGILDSARFRSFIAEELRVSVRSIHAMVLGGHGDFMVPLPRHANVNGVPVESLVEGSVLKKIIERTRAGGGEIIKLEKESSAFYAPASSLATMVEAIVKDKREVLPCAAYLNGEYGIKGIFIGVPVILGSNGVERIIELELTKYEKKQLDQSAQKVKELANEVENVLLKK
jgi:malate dehydrogenase